jgi:nucleoside-diphosphate-sugar epimerase
VARALIVGCGCRGRMLAASLVADGWQVRGTTRLPDHRGAIDRSGADAVIADPERPGSILDQVADVAIIVWLLGSAIGEPEAIAAVHGPRLERVLEKLVDSPVRGFVYEAAGRVRAEYRERGAAVVREAGERWRIRVELVDADPSDAEAWTRAMFDAAGRLTS